MSNIEHLLAVLEYEAAFQYAVEHKSRQHMEKALRDIGFNHTDSVVDKVFVELDIEIQG